MESSNNIKDLGDNLMPCPGDMIVARHNMTSWNSVLEYAPSSGQIYVNEYAIVIQRWLIGHNVRLIVLHNGMIRIFSCKLSNLRRNWKIASLFSC